MKIRVNVRTSSAQGAIRRVRKWGDPVLIDLLGADVNLVGTTNFQVVKLATIDGRGQPFFNDIAQFQTVDYDFLYSLQYPSDGFTVQQKMNWLVNHDLAGGAPSRPYWIVDGKLQFGTMVFGGQLVEIDPASETYIGQYPNREGQEPIEMYRLLGMRKAEMGLVSYATYPHKVQRGTEAGRDNGYNDHPRGEIFHPVWDSRDWKANHGDGQLWIARAFLEEV